mmetsp:Transcript_11120/g.35284  ORF Transcript_11120/g.35284 Transcript_11120/m.35284 type:complete len:364 (-) Transcript_11120:31-1122(-)
MRSSVLLTSYPILYMRAGAACQRPLRRRAICARCRMTQLPRQGPHRRSRSFRAVIAITRQQVLLVQLCEHHRKHEVPLRELVRKVTHQTPSVAIDDCLREDQHLVEFAECVKRPLRPRHRDAKLTDTLQRHIVLLRKNPHIAAHELHGRVSELGHQDGAEDADLDVRRPGLDKVEDMAPETAWNHLVGVIQNENDEVILPKVSHVERVEDAAGHADAPVLALAEPVDVISRRGATDADVALYAPIVFQCLGYRLDLAGQPAHGRQDERLASCPEAAASALEAAYGEGQRLACAELRLADGVTVIMNSLDDALPVGAGLVKAVGVDAAGEVLLVTVVGEELVDGVLLITLAKLPSRHGRSDADP